MKTIGFPISQKENERRRAIMPDDLRSMKHPESCTIEKGYGEPLGLSDAEYERFGAHIASREEVLSQDVICNPKGFDPDMVPLPRPGMTFFGWVHAVQGREVTDILVGHRMTAIAWEDMFEPGRVHVFRRNNEIAGEAAVMHAALLLGRLPGEWNTAILGRGNCARGAWRFLERMGARVTIYPKERMFRLKDEVERYDAVDHATSILHISAARAISAAVAPDLDMIIEETPNAVLEKATAIKNGEILDERITKFQNR